MIKNQKHLRLSGLYGARAPPCANELIQLQDGCQLPSKFGQTIALSTHFLSQFPWSPPTLRVHPKPIHTRPSGANWLPKPGRIPRFVRSLIPIQPLFCCPTESRPFRVMMFPHWQERSRLLNSLQHGNKSQLLAMVCYWFPSRRQWKAIPDHHVNFFPSISFPFVIFQSWLRLLAAPLFPLAAIKKA